MHDLNELYPELPRATQTKEMDGASASAKEILHLLFDSSIGH